MLFKNLSGACLLLASIALGATLGSPATSNLGALNPYLHARQDDPERAPPKCEDGHRQTRCTFDAHGNARMGFADKKINYGNFSMAHLFTTIRNHCKPAPGCIDSTWTIPTQIILDNKRAYGHATVKAIVNTVYTPAQYKDLFDVAEAAMKSIVDVDYRNYETCEGSPLCEDPTHFKHQPQFIAPSTFYVRKPETNQEDAQFIGFTVDVDLDTSGEGDGFCEQFFTAGSAIAGAWSSVAGGAFALLGLICS